MPLQHLPELAVDFRTIRHDSGLVQLAVPESSHLARTMFSISPSVRLTKSQDGGVLLDVEQGEIFSLNPVGVRIIELLQREQTRSSLVLLLSREFTVREEAIAADVDGFLSILRQQHLLNERASGQSFAGGGL